MTSISSVELHGRNVSYGTSDMNIGRKGEDGILQDKKPDIRDSGGPMSLSIEPLLSRK